MIRSHCQGKELLLNVIHNFTQSRSSPPHIVFLSCFEVLIVLFSLSFSWAKSCLHCMNETVTLFSLTLSLLYMANLMFCLFVNVLYEWNVTKTNILICFAECNPQLHTHHAFTTSQFSYHPLKCWLFFSLFYFPLVTAHKCYHNNAWERDKGRNWLTLQNSAVVSLWSMLSPFPVLGLWVWRPVSCIVTSGWTTLLNYFYTSR